MNVNSFLFKQLDDRLLTEEIIFDEFGSYNKKGPLRLSEFRNHHLNYYNHQHRVRRISLMVGMANGLSESELRILNKGALYHDIGKLKIDRKLLDKRDKLTREDIEIFRMHPKYGHDLLIEQRFYDARILVHTHHDYSNNHFLNGDGNSHDLSYPKYSGSINNSLSEMTQMLAASDMVDGMVNRRSYREDLTKVDIIKNVYKDFNGKSIIFVSFALEAYQRLYDNMPK